MPAAYDGPATRTRSRVTNITQALAASYDLGNKSSAKRLSSRQFPRDFFNVAFAVLDATSGEMLNYRQLIQRPEFKKEWSHSSANEFGRLFQGIGGRIAKPTNTCFFINKGQVPTARFKDVTYCKFVCNVREQKKEKNRTRATLGGNRVNYPGDVGTPTADMLLFKVLLNSVVSTPGAKFMSIDISNFYLNTPMDRFEYVKLRLTDIPDEVIREYRLHETGKVTSDGYVYVEVRKGMYGLPQAGILAQELLEKRLSKRGYYQSKLVPGLWRHEWRPVQFTLVVDDFGVKYVGTEHAQHLVDSIDAHYDLETDWHGRKYIGMQLDWDYDHRRVHLSMPGYATKALAELGHPHPQKRQDSPHAHTAPRYGKHPQYAPAPDATPFLDKDGKLFVQKANGKLLYLGRGCDPTILTALSTIAAQQATPTEATMRETKQLLDYVASQEDAVLTFSASDMVLAVHSDASYHSEPQARSRAGGHFFLSSDTVHPPNNGAILTIAKVIKNVMSSAAEAELGALYIMAREAVYIRQILQELGHKQPRTPMQTDNTTAEAIVNNRVQPKRTKAMDMRFHWLRDRELQEQLRFYWRSGKLNYADYFTKHHPTAHHRNIRREFLTPQWVLKDLAKRTAAAAEQHIGEDEAAHFATSAVQIRTNLVALVQEARTQGKTVHAAYSITEIDGRTSLRASARVC